MREIAGVLLFGGAGAGGATQILLPGTLTNAGLSGTVAQQLTVTVSKRGITGTIKPSLTGTIEPPLDGTLDGKLDGDLK